MIHSFIILNQKIVYIFSININFSQLKNSKTSSHDEIIRLNSTSRLLPFTYQSVDCIVALESAQHFKKLEDFIYECKRVLESNGILVFAIPIISEKISNIKDLGILSFTWTSEHYTLEQVTSKIKNSGFKIEHIETIGKNDYPPMADNYMENRKS